MHDHDVTVYGGTISGGTFNGNVTVSSGMIKGGTFNYDVKVQSGTIFDGTFKGDVEITGVGVIYGGTFKGTVKVTDGIIEGGTFDGEVTNRSGAYISKGTFKGEVYNWGTICGGDFKGTVNNQSGASITDGNFYGTVNNEGTISGGNYVSRESITGDGSVENVTYDLGSPSGGTGSPTTDPDPSPSAGKQQDSKAQQKDAQKQPAAPHSHSFEWTVTKEPTKTEDGLEEYKCKGCGAVEASQPISMYMFRVKELYGLVKDAPKGGAVAYDFGNLSTISDYVLAKMAERNDVAVTVSFTYGGEAHSITFPAGTDYAAVLTDAETMYGFYGVAARLGLTVE